ncbi:hypothetical protein C8J56DRAFT_1058566 [Mycena floridula]|nr:hypothetical protein C8J56DRAFT_1058566 [Mycena floridula]
MLNVLRFFFGPLLIYLVTVAFPFADFVWFSKDPSSPTVSTSLQAAQANSRRIVEAPRWRLEFLQAVLSSFLPTADNKFHRSRPGTFINWLLNEYRILLGVFLVATVPLLAIYSLK